jgi:hypothetical protein
MNAQPEYGERFGQLKVIGRVTYKDRGPKYRCECSCGRATLILKARQLNRGEVKSCWKCSK